MTPLTIDELRERFDTEFWRGVAVVICVACNKQATCDRDQILRKWRDHVCGPVTSPWDAHEAIQ